MREIKFRGLHPVTKVVMDVCVIDWMHDEVYFEQGSDVAYQIEECNLMQFTGLTDKNCIDIYESDVVKNEYVTGVVRWDKDYCRFFITANKDGKHISNHSIDSTTEIIGNIHQNPELIK